MLIIPVQAPLLGHAYTNIRPTHVCFHDGQYICFNPICHPREQWLEVQSFINTGKLINHTQVTDPNKPVSAIAKNTGP
jgi:hypothetical protein